MNRVRVKICGIRRAEDALAAADAGADAIGFVFYPASPRAVTIAQAREIDRVLPPFIARVALFLEPAAADVQAVIDEIRPDLLQFHGRETAAFCQRFSVPYMKAVPMGEPDVDLHAWSAAHAGAAALLLDANRAGQAGGRGERFEWRDDPSLPERPIVLAGGLEPNNVAEAITRFAPYAVDVSSGVESAPGVKDTDRMHAFVNAVLNAG